MAWANDMGEGGGRADEPKIQWKDRFPDFQIRSWYGSRLPLIKAPHNPMPQATLLLCRYNVCRNDKQNKTEVVRWQQY